MRWAITTSFQSVSQEYKQGGVHADNSKAFAGVLYLSPNTPLNSGTSFYKKII